jgi:DNA-binding MarR family transcriptional regulator
MPSLKKTHFDITSLLGYRLSRLSAAIGHAADRDAIELAGVSLPEYRVLAVLASIEPQGVVGLQEAMRIDKAWISRTLAKLIDKGLVQSVLDENDARRSMVSLTAKGKRACKVLIERATQRQADILRGINEQDRKRLVELLSQVQENVDSMNKRGQETPG